jgi:hypothetical protein
MRYLALIYGNENADPVPGTSDFDTVMKEYMAFGEEAGAAGVIAGGGEALQPTATATTVRVENGQTLTTDGPFAETKEQLGGFYLLDVADLDEAIAWAAKIPGAWHGRIEVRPVVDFSQS